MLLQLLSVTYGQLKHTSLQLDRKALLMFPVNNSTDTNTAGSGTHWYAGQVAVQPSKQQPPCIWWPCCSHLREV